jgi:hypothetical protein
MPSSDTDPALRAPSAVRRRVPRHQTRGLDIGALERENKGSGVIGIRPGDRGVWMRTILTAIVVALVATQVAKADEEVDLELVLLADASGSIDDAEIAFQRQGYALAITHPQVLSAILQGFSQRIAVTYVEWGDENSQAIVVPWSIVDGEDSAVAFANALLNAPREAFGMNAIGSALALAHVLIDGNDIDGWRRVIDISADSANSWGGVPIEAARAAILASGIVINGLAILCRDEDCSGRPVLYDVEAAFAETITGGPGSFVVTADGRSRFAEAVRRKLILEIAADPAAVSTDVAASMINTTDR